MAQGCSSSGSLLYHASSTVYSFSPFSSFSLLLSDRSLARLVRCIIIAATGEGGGGGGGEGGDGVRACTVQFSPETSNRFQASARDLYTRETCVCAWIEFNIPWIQDFARGRRAIFMMFQRRLGEIYARLSVWIKIRGIVILSRNPFTSTTRCTYKFAQK